MTPEQVPQEVTHLLAAWNLVWAILGGIVTVLLGIGAAILAALRRSQKALTDTCDRIETRVNQINGRLGRAETRIDDHERTCAERTERLDEDMRRVHERIDGLRLPNGALS